jgi:DNA-directed RNA polymerase specialized sigma subunit
MTMCSRRGSPEYGSSTVWVSASPEWVHSEEELRRLIENFAVSLPDERERLVLALYWLDERSLSWIAADMMISEDSAWGILRRVSLKLADHLRRRGYGAS